MELGWTCKFYGKIFFVNSYIPGVKTKEGDGGGEISRKGLRSINTVNPINKWF